MTIKKQWLIVLISIAVFSVIVNSFVLSSLTNQYFKDYMKSNYVNHYNQIVDYVTTMLKDKNYSADQMEIELETHLVDPITSIKVYDSKNVLIADVSTDVQNFMGNGMMHGMMNRMQNSQYEEVDNAKISNEGQIIGQVNITKYSSAEKSAAALLFQASLFRNSMLSIGIVLLFTIIIGMLISRRMSRDLVHTADMAQRIDMGNSMVTSSSKVKEIRIIQQSLESLQSRLMLRQKSRKALIDELVHQTRTPLTIIKTHLEGIEDGIIDMGSEEIKICHDQVENITNIITNMSGMIDAEKQDSSVKVEEIEINQLLKQIVNGLKVQFEKKNIELKFIEGQKLTISSDKYKISQSVYNILTNAYKFTPSSGRVQIDYQVNPENIILTIEDNGPGISKEEQQRIFDAYYKGNRSTDKSGEGIGLYIANENLKSIKGWISVESTLGKGSKFILNIPRQVNIG